MLTGILERIVRGVLDLHSGASRLRGFPNVMFRLETGGVSFLHLGDNRADWPADVASSIGDIDVLLVTVDDSSHLSSYEELDSLIQRLEPRVVIPMHYQIPGLTGDGTGLEPPEGWLDTQPRVKRLDGHTAVFSPRNLPSQTRSGYFNRRPRPSPARRLRRRAVPRPAPLLSSPERRLRTSLTIARI